MAVHQYRVRQNTLKGPQVVGFFKTFGKAHIFATMRQRETGRVFRIERRPPMGCGWEIAQELVPQTQSPIEASIARGRFPKVQDQSGRKGRVLSYIRPTREVRVAWVDQDRTGAGQVVHVDQLAMRP